jgi:hypothetical protein
MDALVELSFFPAHALNPTRVTATAAIVRNFDMDLFASFLQQVADGI